MTPECNGKLFEFHPLGQREARTNFAGGAITRDGGGLLLREVEKRTGIVARFEDYFRDHRDAERIEPRVEDLVAQRVYGLALGYEDWNDHAGGAYIVLNVCAEGPSSDGRWPGNWGERGQVATWHGHPGRDPHHGRARPCHIKSHVGATPTPAHKRS